MIFTHKLLAARGNSEFFKTKATRKLKTNVAFVDLVNELSNEYLCKKIGVDRSVDRSAENDPFKVGDRKRLVQVMSSGEN